MVLLILLSGCPHATDAEKTIIEVANTKSSSRAADVVFVHGLDGNGRLTWQVDGLADTFWPSWIGRDFPDLGVWSINYEASSTKWAGRAMPFEDRATNILNRLCVKGIGTTRPLLFVAHSLGGLVVKEMLRRAWTLRNPEWESIARNTKGVAFLATPHTGSGFANFVDSLQRIFFITKQTNVSIDDLKANEAVLRDLNEWYRNNAAQNGIATLVLYEKYEYRGVKVVTEGSADPGITGVYPIPVDADHVSISKPASRESDIYQTVKRFVGENVGELGDLHKWQLVDLTGGKIPPHLEAIREQLVGPTGPLSPHSRQILTQERHAHHYEPPDVDRLVFQSDLLSRRIALPSMSIPKGINARLLIYALDENEGRSRLIVDPDTFHDGGPVKIEPSKVTGRFRLIAFVFPTDEAAYRYFRDKSMNEVLER